MDLTIAEAAAQLGKSERAVRAQIQRGNLVAYKRGGRWLLPKHKLPLTAAEHSRLAAKVDQVRDAVERALPEPFRQARTTLSVNAVFVELQGLHGRLTGAPTTGEPIVTAATDAIQALAEAHFEFDKGRKLAALRRARARLSHACALLLLGEAASIGAEIEMSLMPKLGGLIRWAEGLEGTKRR